MPNAPEAPHGDGASFLDGIVTGKKDEGPTEWPSSMGKRLSVPHAPPAVAERPKLSAVVGRDDGVVRIPQEAWFALSNCIARQSRVRRFYRHSPVEGIGGVDKYVFRFDRATGTIDMRVIYGFLHESSIADRLKEATTASGDAHRKREHARQALERVQSEAAPFLSGPEYDAEAEPGTQRYVAEETKKRFLQAIDRATDAYQEAIETAEAAADAVKQVQAEKAKGHEDYKRFTLDDIAEGRVLPTFPAREAAQGAA